MILMKKILLSMLMLLCVSALFAATPAEGLVQKYKDVKGARDLVAGKTLLRLVRPMMDDYQIAPIAHKVEQLAVVRLDKTSQEVRNMFVNDLKNAFTRYSYGGQSVTKNGTVDVYVHMKSEDVVDELVVFNPEKYVLSILKGIFPVEELLKLYKGKTDKN